MRRVARRLIAGADIGTYIGMRTISVHVDEGVYERLKQLAAQEGQPTAELIRRAMARYLEQQAPAHSILDVPPVRCGGLIADWTRAELWDEMFDR